ncbi:MAG: hypothetical protein Alpg2KO_16840 [Alphaproteobacteria bacterium]
MRISNAGMNQIFQSDLGAVRTQIADLQRQISSGKKSETHAGLGPDIRLSLDLRARISSIETYDRNINRAQFRLNTADAALTRIGEIAQEMRDDALSTLNGGDPNMELFQTRARAAVNEVTQLMNTRVDGRYIFSGIDTDTEPMSDTGPLFTAVQGFVAGYTDATAAADYANVQAHFTTTTNYYQGDTSATVQTTRIDENYDLEYSTRADDAGIQQVLAGIYALSELDYDATNADGFETIINAIATDLAAGSVNVNNEVARLGDLNSMMDDLTVRHEAMDLILQTEISNVEDVDVAEAILELQTLQTQLEASYNTIGSMRNLSLTRFI